MIFLPVSSVHCVVQVGLLEKHFSDLKVDFLIFWNVVRNFAAIQMRIW